MHPADTSVTPLARLDFRGHAYSCVFAHLSKQAQLPASKTVAVRSRISRRIWLGDIRMRSFADKQDRATGVVIVVIVQAVPLKGVQNLSD